MSVHEAIQIPDENALRKRLLAAVEEISGVLEAESAVSEATGAPTAAMVEAMHGAGLIGIKAPFAVGGLEASPTLQIEVLERVAYHSIAAAWCLMLYIDNTGRALAHLPQGGVDRLLAGGRIPAVAGGGGMMMGSLTPAEGGFRLSGRWIYGSGIHQADYVLVGAVVPAEGEERPVMHTCIVPKAAFTIADNWKVLGLKGTGSADFSCEDVFLAAEMTFRGQEVQRGGPLYKLGTMGYAGLCLPAVTVGLARRALDDLTRTAAQKARGYMKKTPLAARGVFQVFLGEADQKLKAARALNIETSEKALADVARLGSSSMANEAAVRAAGAWGVRTATDVVDNVVRYAGGEGVRIGHLFERTLRDLHMAGTHMFVSDVAYEIHAQVMLGLPEANAMN